MIEVYQVTIFLTTVAIAIGVGRSLHISVSRSMGLFMWHTLFCLIYAQYDLDNSDVSFYYNSGLLAGNNEFGFGRLFIQWMSEVLIQRLNFDFFEIFVLFNMFGFFGLILLDATIKQLHFLTKTSESLYVWIPFIPGISFWSCALGKDGIAFSASLLAVYASIDIQKRVIFLASGVFFMLLVRPHIALMMAGAAAIAMMASNKIAVSIRLSIVAGITVFFVAITGFVIQYIGADGISNTDDLFDAIENIENKSPLGVTGVDLSQMSLPMKLFTYLFRPLFIDAPGILGIAVSFENSILLILLLSSLSHLYKRFQSDRSFFFVYNLSYFLLGLVILGMITGNLGIAIRQKWMILPGFLVISVFATLEQGRRNIPSSRRAIAPRPNSPMKPNS